MKTFLIGDTHFGHRNIITFKREDGSPLRDPQSVGRWKGNIHGHLHSNTIPDARYVNVSAEQVNYTPIDFEEIRKLCPT